MKKSSTIRLVPKRNGHQNVLLHNNQLSIAKKLLNYFNQCCIDYPIHFKRANSWFALRVIKSADADLYIGAISYGLKDSMQTRKGISYHGKTAYVVCDDYCVK